MQGVLEKPSARRQDEFLAAVERSRRLHRGGFEQDGVRTRRLGLGHREATADASLDQRAEETLSLLESAEPVQDLDVPRVGGLRIEHEVSERRAAECLAE